MGHVVSAQGVAVDQSKVQAVVEWPVPKTLKALRGFLGLTGYYRKFIKGYSTLAAPLTALTKKHAFLWTEATQVAFETLKKNSHQSFSFGPSQLFCSLCDRM